MLRCMVEPSVAERSVFLHREYFENGRLVTSSVVSATEKDVVTASGEHIPYDFLVIATGSTFDGPTTKQGRIKQFEAENKKIKDAGTILIIGGGPTGIELAGEIAVDFPEKKVIVVHGGSRLTEFLGPKVSQKTLDWLISKKVEVHLNERIDLKSLSESTTTYKTSSGITISADCHFVCTGSRVGSSWLKDSVFRDLVDKEGHLIVDDSLRLQGKTNVFAIGDIVNVKEIKQGFLAKKHADVVAANIMMLLKGPNSKKKVSTYKASSAMGIVSLGRVDAVAQFPFNITMVGWIPGKLKSKHLFIEKTRQGLGVKS
eukprot:Gb_24737 [translate_table: standard]